MPNASGLAASVRGSSESSTFDLGGQNVTTITNTITSAFQDPLPVQEMIRITFVTGAGKLARQKYDANAAKTVTSALRELGFEEDRGASCVKECAGSYKLQHDTGKNLKTVVVFPNIQASDDPASTEGSTSHSTSTSPLIPKGSVEDLIISTSKGVFENMTKSKCPSWSEKKACLATLAELKIMLSDLDQKLVSGKPLTNSEQDFYDSVSSDSIEEKQNIVKDLMHGQVEEGAITHREKQQLLSQINERLGKVEAELTEAKAKKAEKLNGMKTKMQARKVMLSGITPQSSHKLKHESEILNLRAEIRSLNVDDKGGRLLSLKESKALARKEDIEEEILDLEVKSRGWFEDDESFEARANSCRAKAASAPKKGGSKSAKPASRPTAPAWVATTSTKKKKPRSKAASGGSKKSSGAGGVFAAMMLDSDSD